VQRSHCIPGNTSTVQVWMRMVLDLTATPNHYFMRDFACPNVPASSTSSIHAIQNAPRNHCSYGMFAAKGEHMDEDDTSQAGSDQDKTAASTSRALPGTRPAAACDGPQAAVCNVVAALDRVCHEMCGLDVRTRCACSIGRPGASITCSVQPHSACVLHSFVHTVTVHVVNTPPYSSITTRIDAHVHLHPSMSS
jgi:hypothetical protein